MTLFDMSEDSKTLKGFRASIGDVFSKFGLTPNQWTMLSIAAGIVAAILLSAEQFVSGAFFIVISGFLDLVDGAVARHTGKSSKEGAYIDTVVDRYNEFLYIVPLFFIAMPGVILVPSLWAGLLLFGSMITTYSKAAAKEKELGIAEIRGGLVERAERVSLLTIGYFLAAFDVTLLSFIVAVLAVLTNISALQRIKKTLDGVSAMQIPEKKEELEQTERPVFEKEGKSIGETVAAEEEKEERKRMILPPKKTDEKRKAPPLKL